MRKPCWLGSASCAQYSVKRISVSVSYHFLKPELPATFAITLPTVNRVGLNFGHCEGASTIRLSSLVDMWACRAAKVAALGINDPMREGNIS